MLEELEHDISDITLIPSRGGVFEVVVDGELAFSKKETGKHADFDDVVREMKARLG